MFLPHLMKREQAPVYVGAVAQTIVSGIVSDPPSDDFLIRAADPVNAPAVLSTGTVVVASFPTSAVTFFAPEGNPDGELTDAEYDEHCEIIRQRRKQKQDSDFAEMNRKREQAKTQFIADSTAVPVAPSALSAAAERGFRKTVYRCHENGVSLWFKRDSSALWRFYVYDSERDCFSVVGPHYRTKAELVDDTERYALEYGFKNPPSESFSDRPAGNVLPIITTGTGYFRPGLRGTAVFQEMRTVFIGPPGQETKTQIPEYSVTLNGSGHRNHCQAGRDFEFAQQKKRPSAKQLHCGQTERHDTERGSDDNIVTILFSEHGKFNVQQTAKYPRERGTLAFHSFDSLDDARDYFDSLTQ